MRAKVSSHLTNPLQMTTFWKPLLQWTNLAQGHNGNINWSERDLNHSLPFWIQGILTHGYSGFRRISDLFKWEYYALKTTTGIQHYTSYIWQNTQTKQSKWSTPLRCVRLRQMEFINFFLYHTAAIKVLLSIITNIHSTLKLWQSDFNIKTK